MQACGAPPETIAAYRAQLFSEAEQRSIDIFPENWHAWNVFRAMGSQWRVVAGFGGKSYEGLDYASLPIPLAEHRHVQPRQPLHLLMPQIRTLERAAREILNRD